MDGKIPAELPAVTTDSEQKAEEIVSDIGVIKESDQLPDIFAGLLVQNLPAPAPTAVLTVQSGTINDQIAITERLVKNGLPALVVEQLSPEQLKFLNKLTDAQIEKLSAFDLETLGILPEKIAQQIESLKNLETKIIPRPSPLPPEYTTETAKTLNNLTIGPEQTTEESVEDILRQFTADGADEAVDASPARTLGKDVISSFSDFLKNASTGRLQTGADLIGGSVPGALLSGGETTTGGSLDNNFTLGGSQQSNQAAQIQTLARANIAAGAHPVTGIIAATLTKGASGAAKDLTVQLHPAELGRVNVKVSVGKDKSVNAVLTIEKPETYLMLQKDQAALQQTLQNLGINAGGELSFQLAHDGAFNRNQNQNGSQNNSAQATTENNNIIEIDTGAHWFTDPTTGRTHYNILA